MPATHAGISDISKSHNEFMGSLLMNRKCNQDKARLFTWAKIPLWRDEMTVEVYGISVYIAGAGATSGISAIFPSTSGTSTFSPYQHAHKGKKASINLM